MSTLTYATVAINEVRSHPQNPRRGDVSAIARSLEVHRQYRPIVVQRSSGFILAGNHTWQAARQLGWDTIDVAYVDVDDDQAVRILLVDNRLSDVATYDDGALTALLAEVASRPSALEGTGWTAPDLEDLMQMATTDAAGQRDEFQGLKRSMGGPSWVRSLPIDAIFTYNPPWNYPTVIAQAAGLHIGCRSVSSDGRPWLAGNQDRLWRTPIRFVDNEYLHYDHALHLDVVAQLRPRLATVRDVMTRSQCRAAGIDYYDLDTILGFADQAAEHAELVIVIPKFDCISDIPERFVLGYSVPSRYGATPLPIERFEGRRTHLLGGSWKAQLAYLDRLRDDVISLDFNSLNRLTQLGQFYAPGGESMSLVDLGLGTLSAFWPVTLALSFAAIVTDLRRLYPPTPLPDVAEVFPDQEER